MNYNREIPDYGDVMTIDEWNDAVELGLFTTYDGQGYYCKDGKMSNLEVFTVTTPHDATHVCWFNK